MLKCGTHLGRDTCFIRDRSRHLPSPTHTHNPHTLPPQLQEEFGFGVVCCALGIGLTKYDPPLPPPRGIIFKEWRDWEQGGKALPWVLGPSIRPVSSFNQAPTDTSLGPDPSWSGCLAQEPGLQHSAAEPVSDRGGAQRAQGYSPAAVASD